jgi:hypothetical protein
LQPFFIVPQDDFFVEHADFFAFFTVFFFAAMTILRERDARG